ncbi:hypothetical protein Q5P01_012337 [Channa striata]|uniref:Fibrinogen C-terminal domain-containing protein n=1 Tax=Channa striata TaxID=64152 RepID=A0AA88SLI3_CHASR|nr:hypothetical protein Q5P01_012337 [Channa striata]
MRLTALCICGILLALSSLSWTTTYSGEGDLLEDKSFGPCVATLRPEGECRQGQDENTCPYIFTLPPLTVYLPKQLRELEKIVKDLQMLKDNVDQLKKICAVRQTERGCERQREREQEKLNEGAARHERNWMNEKDAEILKESGTNRTNVEKIEINGHTDRTILEEREIKKCQAEREEKGVLKENNKEDPVKEVGEKKVKPQTERVNEKDKLGQTELPTAGGKERIVDTARERAVENSNRETDADIKKEKDEKGFLKGEQSDHVDSGDKRQMTINIKKKEEIPESDHYVRRDEMKEAENKTQSEKDEKDKGGDGIKMSQEHDVHTNKEKEQHQEENNEMEKVKQTENIGSAITEIIKAWEVEDDGDKETGKEIKTKETVPIVQRDTDEELASSKATVNTDSVPISPSPLSAIRLAAKNDAMDLNKDISFTPSTPLSSFPSNSITDTNQSMITASKLPAPNTGAAGISEHPSSSTTLRTLSGPGNQMAGSGTRLISTTSTRPGAGVGAQVGSTTASTTPSHNLYSTTSPESGDNSHWTAKKNIGSNTGTGLKPSSGREPKPGEKHKSGIKPDTDQKPHNLKNYHKPDRAALSDKTTKHDQKQKTSQPKPLTDQESKPGKDTKHIADVTHSRGDAEFSPNTMKTITLGPKTYNTLETGSFPRHYSNPKGFTTSSNSRIMSDVKPQAAGQLSSIPVTQRTNNIRGISPGPATPNPESNTDYSLEDVIIHNIEKPAPRQIPDPDKIMIPVPSPRTQTTSTVSPDFRSPTPAQSEPPASSTPSARELRVKINQVAALLNNSLILNGRPQDGHSKEHPKEKKGGSRPVNTSSKLPTLTSSKGKKQYFTLSQALCPYWVRQQLRLSPPFTIVRRDCSDHLLPGQTKSGVYLVTPDLRSKSFPVFCDMELAGGGWTLIQRRKDGSVSFNRTWVEYRSGFGELDGGEFWLGNTMIHLLTRDRDMVLRVELEDLDGVVEHAQYEQFRVAGERLRYRLTVGGYSGTAGDALRFSKTYDHNNRAFTTPDRDHDRYPSGNCGAYYSSGWWFDACMAANLNGRYYVDKYKGIRDGIFWGTWHNISTEYYPVNERQSFKSVRMMIRPKSFAP